MSGFTDAQARYEKWWLGKRCRRRWTDDPFRKVVAIRLYGPNAFVTGVVDVEFEDGTVEHAPMGVNDWKPPKSAMEVEPDQPSG